MLEKDIPINIQQYENYKEQFKRLNKAVDNNYYLEAIFIEYAIMEDRTESILRRGGLWDAYIKHRKGHSITIDSKVKYIKNHAAQKGTLINKYFSDDLLEELLVWKEDRNKLIHILMKQALTTEILEELAFKGKAIARILTNRSKNYRRAVERATKNEGK